MRSEEHTSELQSLAYLVCRLLLEKKKEEQSMVDHALEPADPIILHAHYTSSPMPRSPVHNYYFINAPSPPEISTLSLHDALPISVRPNFGPPITRVLRLFHGGGLDAPAWFCSKIGGLLPIAP